MPEMTVSNLRKSFGKVKAVDGVSFDVRKGEIMTLLGPSGSGKTTILRLIAGLEKPDDGEIHVGSRMLDSAIQRVHTPPEKRGMGMVFQSYAIWPHMTVFENIAFPLRVRKLPKEVIREKVNKTLSLLQLDGLANRYGTQLSGGQQQRVAVARALVFDPEILLLDEPLSNLDAKLRDQTRVELKALQRRLGITTIFVTHDQAEAMVLSDRLAVMNQGQIVQLGTASSIYEKPQTKFIQEFIGRANYMPGKVIDTSPKGVWVKVKHVDQPPLCCIPREDIGVGEEVVLYVRMHEIGVCPGPSEKPNTWCAKIMQVFYMGDSIEYEIQVGARNLRVATLPSQKRFDVADTVYIEMPSDCILAWRSDSR